MISRRVFLGRAGELAALGAVAGAGLSPLAAGRTKSGGGGAAEAFDLEVRFTGLCLFWSPDPKPAPPPKIQHVLLVKAMAGEKQHYPRVYYDAAYDSNVPPGEYWRTVPLDDTVLNLSLFPGVDTQIPDIPDLLDVSKITNARLIDPEQKKPPNLACRVTLPAGVVRADPSLDYSYQWRLEPPNVTPTPPEYGFYRLAWRVVWTIRGINAFQLGWKLDPLSTPANGSPESLVALKPVNGKIKLLISNVRLEETGHQIPDLDTTQPPACGTELQDFQMFRHLYGVHGPWHKLINRKECAGPTGQPYTCLPSGGH